jgi:hypothetical protein
LSKGAHRFLPVQRLFVCAKGEAAMRIRRNHITQKIFNNILFLAEVFGDRADKDIPKLPVLEMAQCFELERPKVARMNRRGSPSWPLWK